MKGRSFGRSGVRTTRQFIVLPSNLVGGTKEEKETRKHKVKFSVYVPNYKKRGEQGHCKALPLMISLEADFGEHCVSPYIFTVADSGFSKRFLACQRVGKRLFFFFFYIF